MRRARHVLFVALAGHGHVTPTLPLVEGLVQRGHRVAYATAADFAEAVTDVRGERLPDVAGPLVVAGSAAPGICFRVGGADRHAAVGRAAAHLVVGRDASGAGLSRHGGLRPRRRLTTGIPAGAVQHTACPAR